MRTTALALKPRDAEIEQLLHKEEPKDCGVCSVRGVAKRVTLFFFEEEIR